MFNREYSIDHRGSRAFVRRRRILLQQSKTLIDPKNFASAERDCQ
jgi:hypothetical protein